MLWIRSGRRGGADLLHRFQRAERVLEDHLHLRAVAISAGAARFAPSVPWKEMTPELGL